MIGQKIFFFDIGIQVHQLILIDIDHLAGIFNSLLIIFHVEIDPAEQSLRSRLVNPDGGGFIGVCQRFLCFQQICNDLIIYLFGTAADNELVIDGGICFQRNAEISSRSSQFVRLSVNVYQYEVVPGSKEKGFSGYSLQCSARLAFLQQ